MNTQGKDHGSKSHLDAYRKLRPGDLDAAIRASAGLGDVPLEWVYPTPGKTGAPEPKGVNFLKGRPDVRALWKEFWPQRGNQQRWDGVAKCGDTWLLMEAKANHPEFCTPPCGAKAEGGRKQIEKVLNQTKKVLGVHVHFTWLGSYYQYANRLAVLYFLAEKARPPVDARLVFIYFCGDRFPDGRPCPASRPEWQPLIEARRLTLGLPGRHPLSDRIHEVFLEVLRHSDK
ncbi:MAG: hypothetical protein H6Q86_3172 [candidate division NC10 bacterium]|nr:hypothetical protein [candidate division NC10 bacterium]